MVAESQPTGAIMKRYKLEFEYVSPYDGTWTPASKESDDLDSLKRQRDNQLAMADVRNSMITFQETTDWQILPEEIAP
jgi:hypothetical protein